MLFSKLSKKKPIQEEKPIIKLPDNMIINDVNILIGIKRWIKNLENGPDDIFYSFLMMLEQLGFDITKKITFGNYYTTNNQNFIEFDCTIDDNNMTENIKTIRLEYKKEPSISNTFSIASGKMIKKYICNYFFNKIDAWIKAKECNRNGNKYVRSYDQDHYYSGKLYNQNNLLIEITIEEPNPHFDMRIPYELKNEDDLMDMLLDLTSSISINEFYKKIKVLLDEVNYNYQGVSICYKTGFSHSYITDYIKIYSSKLLEYKYTKGNVVFSIDVEGDINYCDRNKFLPNSSNEILVNEVISNINHFKEQAEEIVKSLIKK